MGQRNWIGRSEGSEIKFKLIIDSHLKQILFSDSHSCLNVVDENNLAHVAKSTVSSGLGNIKVFTTRADTLFGATYVVLAPEHELVNKLINNEELIIKNKDEVEKYINSVKNKTDEDRTKNDKDKTGVELKGIRAINPANGEEIPVWIADYVLAGYGTGAVMAVPAHDERDFDFAKKYNLPIKNVIASKFDGDILPNAVRRDGALCVLKNKDNQILILQQKDNSEMKNLIIPQGGIEKNEKPLETALRELEEETEYCDFVFEKELGVKELYYHAGYKKVNRHRFAFGFSFILNSNRKSPISKEDEENWNYYWVSQDEANKYLIKEHADFVNKSFKDNCFIDDGIVVNSEQFSFMTSEEARKKITEFVGGKIVTKYKLRDWVFSRQRYWGEPIPIIYCEKCARLRGQGHVPVPEKQLPVLLPKVKSYQPTDNGESPLANIKSWVNTTCPKCKGKAKRETDTMPNWAGSSWYYLRYMDPKNKKEFASKKNLKYWSPVDWYNGGMEHTTLHLLYSRFWHKFLYDLKLVPTKEPYQKRTAHGMILAGDGEKMSKSRGNVINPDSIIKLYGADTLRVYEMFIGPFDQTAVWNTNSIIGSRRFLEKVWRIGQQIALYDTFSTNSSIQNLSASVSFQTLLHKTIKKVSEDIESMNFNTAISSMMVLVNNMEKSEISKKDFKIFLQMLSPFAPHITEELWEQLRINNEELKIKNKNKKLNTSIHLSSWPKWDKNKIIEEEIKIAVQVNGKVRAEIMVPKDISEDEIRALVLQEKSIIPWIENKEIKRFIYVPGRIINIVV